MSKLTHIMAVVVYAAVAAASLMSLAVAASDRASVAGHEGCQAALCFVALF